MDLPGPVETMLNDLGFTWPEVDETELMSVGSAWLGLSGPIRDSRQLASDAADRVASINHGAAVDAFRQKWSGDDAPAAVLDSAATGVDVGGAALLMCGGVVLALKINTIINITILIAEIAEAIATAVPTFGLSLLEIPVFKEVTSRIVQALINEAVSAVMG